MRVPLGGGVLGRHSDGEAELFQASDQPLLDPLALAGIEVSAAQLGIGRPTLEQTDGEPLPTVEVPIPQGEEGRELYRRLAGLAATERLRVLRAEPTVT